MEERLEEDNLTIAARETLMNLRERVNKWMSQDLKNALGQEVRSMRKNIEEELRAIEAAEDE